MLKSVLDFFVCIIIFCFPYGVLASGALVVNDGLHLSLTGANPYDVILIMPPAPRRGH